MLDAHREPGIVSVIGYAHGGGQDCHADDRAHHRADDNADECRDQLHGGTG